VLVIGFGRFGQIAVQALIARQHKVSIIDIDTDMIRAAATFGMKVYYGDGTRLDILRAAGAGTADLILVCVDGKELATSIVRLVKSEFPLAKVFARAFDRGHAIELIKLDVDYQIREMFESALVFGGEALAALGSDADEVAEVLEGVRARDRQRFEAQVVGGISAGRDLLLSNAEEQAREGGRTGAPSEPVVPPDEEPADA
jgi:glutathione-regulated potassium-efflux system protein KefB